MIVPAVAALLILASYLTGAIPFGYLIARWRGVDILHQGSGNIGATNVGRVLGRRFGVLAFVLDFAKGALPVAAAMWTTGHMSSEVRATLGEDGLGVAAGLAAFLGHLFPIYLHFRGGKGVATGAGVVAVLLPWETLGALLVWVAIVCATRYVSVASLSAAAVLCASRLLWTPTPFASDHATLTAFSLVAAGLVCARHRTNLVRLLHGTENRLQETQAMLLLTKTIHVLALGLWFGSLVFFTVVVAPAIFRTFQSPEKSLPAERDLWQPLLKQFDEAHEKTGTRLAGAAVGPIFPWFFWLQGVCGLLAVATALPWSWSQPQHTVHRVRSLVLILALVTVLAGWPMAQKVGGLRLKRYSADATVAQQANADFGTWHGYSLGLTLGTMALVAVAMGLAAQLPACQEPQPVDTRKKAEVDKVTR